MSPLQIGAAAGALLAAAAWCVARSVQRAPRSLAVARRSLHGTAHTHHAGHATTRWSRAADSLVGTVPGRWVERHLGPGLHTIELGVADVITRTAVAACAAALAILSSATALVASGVLTVSPLLPLAALAGAALAAWVIVHDISSKIARRHRALRRASNDFVQLVAVGLSTDQSVEEAARFALSVGSGDAFDALRADLEAAPQRGVPIWEAIDEFGRRYAIRELTELASSVERQGLQGVSIGATVASLATAMRAKALDELEREADAANANLAGPTIGFVVTTIVFLAYPLAQRIGEAFGG